MKKLTSLVLAIMILICCAIVPFSAQAGTNPKSTSISSLTATQSGFSVKWKKVSAITGYQIQYSTNSKFKKDNKSVKIKKSSSTSKTVSKLKSNKKYFVRIRTYKTSGKKTYYSKWSAVKNVTITQSTTECNHKYSAVYETQTVCVSEAYDEPIYDTYEKFRQTGVCATCGITTPELQAQGINNVGLHAALTGHTMSPYGTWISVGMVTEQVGTIHHDAVYETKEVLVGYKCSKCGATKSA